MNPSRPLLLLAAALLLSVPPAWATDVYLKIKGVDGEATDRAAALPVEAWSLGEGTARPARTAATHVEQSGLATGKRTHQAIRIEKRLDFVAAESDNPTLRQLVSLCASGATLPEALFAAADQRWELKEVVVTSCALAEGRREIRLKGHITLIK